MSEASGKITSLECMNIGTAASVDRKIADLKISPKQRFPKYTLRPLRKRKQTIKMDPKWSFLNGTTFRSNIGQKLEKKKVLKVENEAMAALVPVKDDNFAEWWYKDHQRLAEQAEQAEKEYKYAISLHSESL
jgi:hypothetical protein